MHDHSSSTRTHVASATLFLTICLTILAGPLLLAGDVPGDLGDARFNLYILEHIYQWLSGSALSLSSPAMFHPFPDTLFFGDTHAGSALIYIFFRALGGSEYVAFDLWFFTGYLTTFIAAYYALARMGAGLLSAGFGATVFAFSLPSLAQFNHAQLVYRCGVPLALLHLWLAAQSGAARHLLVALTWLCLQALTSIYLGVFLFLLMILFALALVIDNRMLRNGSPAFGQAEQGAARLYRWPAARDGLLIALPILLVATAAVLYGHAHTSLIYDLVRSRDEIASMLPRPESYLLMDPLPYWRRITAGVGGLIPMRGEHNMFMGLGVLGLSLAGLVALGRSPNAGVGIMPGRAMLAAGIALALLMTVFGGFSLYRIVALAAGFNAIRAATRFVLVLMFPVAVVAAIGLRFLIGGLKLRGLRISVALLLTLLSGYEIIAIVKPVFSADKADRRAEAIAAEARSRAGDTSAPILAVIEPGETWYVVQLDAMMAALRLGWPTVNGYSGNFVPGWIGIPSPTCDMAKREFAAFETWRRIHNVGPDVDAADLLRRTISVGCQTSDGSPQSKGGRRREPR